MATHLQTRPPSLVCTAPAPLGSSLLQEALGGVAAALRHAAGDHTSAQRVQRVLSCLHALVVVHLRQRSQELEFDAQAPLLISMLISATISAWLEKGKPAMTSRMKWPPFRPLATHPRLAPSLVLAVCMQ